jgi:diguanylate cyclase
LAYLTSSYDLGVVAASLVLASFASYVTLDLADRVRTRDSAMARAWWIAGSLVMGTGIWSMHFVGMLAFALPIALGYSKALTLLSWVAAVAVSAIALGFASRGSLTAPRLAVGALTMAVGICGMHYIGMAAMAMSPAVVWNFWLVAASVLIAVGASAAALLIFFWLREVGDGRGRVYRLVAALVMGVAISGMHYTGMAAASFPQGSVCLSAGSLGGSSLGIWVVAASLGLLLVTLLTSILDARMQGQTNRLAQSLAIANRELMAANEELRERAFLDPLTGLPNRLLFEDRLQHAVARNERARAAVTGADEPCRLAVMFIDLDGFKPVNDSFGHAAGDLVLKEATARLRQVARASDTVARVGGDEFLLLMEDVPDAADCIALARRLVEDLQRPFCAVDQPVHLSASVGILVYPDHGDCDKVVAQADAAMYAAKRAGGGTYALYEASMDEGAQEQMHLQHDLRQAIERGQLELHYQPKIDGLSGRLCGVEALLRWHHPLRGWVSPGVFIPIAERFGLIVTLGNWVVEEACRQMRAWTDAGASIHVAINLSVHQLFDASLAALVERALRLNRLKPGQLLCEITESAAMGDIKVAQRTFDALARIGVFLAIDDFGTGYSSLSYLRQLPARQLKIDRSFINDLESSADAQSIVDAVVRLAHALGLRVVAEGVESAGQRDVLLRLGCDELQGYFFARPMPADALLDWVTAHRSAGAHGHRAAVAPELRSVA